MMKLTKTISLTAILVLSGAPALADDDAAEATIRLMGEAEMERPEAVTKEITLPKHLLVATDDQRRAVERAEQGLAKANERNDHRESGQMQADAARERIADMQEKARENRENRGRADDRPDPPANR